MCPAQAVCPDDGGGPAGEDPPTHLEAQWWDEAHPAGMVIPWFESARDQYPGLYE